MAVWRSDIDGLATQAGRLRNKVGAPALVDHANRQSRPRRSRSAIQEMGAAASWCAHRPPRISSLPGSGPAANAQAQGAAARPRGSGSDLIPSRAKLASNSPYQSPVQHDRAGADEPCSGISAQPVSEPPQFGCFNSMPLRPQAEHLSVRLATRSSQLTDEAMDAPRLALADALRAAGIPPERFPAPHPGQVWQA